jgi:DNA-binding beta-propeller fold protein YncE
MDFEEIAMQFGFWKATALAAVAGVMVMTSHAQPQGGYRILRTIALGGEGSWDYLRFDPEGRRLFIARSSRVMVVDLEHGKLAGEIPDTAGVHGLALVPEIHRGVTSNGKANTATVFDLGSLKSIATVVTGEKPDAILWDPFSKTVLTMNGHSNSITILDPESAKVLGTIALPGRPETAVSDEGGKIFVNLEDKGQIAEIDISKRAVLGAWDLAGCTEPTGLAIDLRDHAHKRLFSACHSGVLMVVDAESGKVVQKLPIGNGVDAAAFDPATQTVFTSNGEGSISVIQQSDADSYRILATIKTLPGAKTMAIDPDRHRIYTVANQNGQFVLLEIGR